MICLDFILPSKIGQLISYVFHRLPHLFSENGRNVLEIFFGFGSRTLNQLLNTVLHKLPGMYWEKSIFKSPYPNTYNMTTTEYVLSSLISKYYQYLKSEKLTVPFIATVYSAPFIQLRGRIAV